MVFAPVFPVQNKDSLAAWCVCVNCVKRLEKGTMRFFDQLIFLRNRISIKIKPKVVRLCDKASVGLLVVQLRLKFCSLDAAVQICTRSTPSNRRRSWTSTTTQRPSNTCGLVMKWTFVCAARGTRRRSFGTKRLHPTGAADVIVPALVNWTDLCSSELTGD